MTMVQRLPRQLSLFGVEARPPNPLDLEGLLAGAGQLTRMGGTARVSLVVDAPWRAAALRAECALRGVASIVGPPDDGFTDFRTAYSAALAPLGARWLRGAEKCPPEHFVLDGRRLRLWVIAAGAPDGAHAFHLSVTAPERRAAVEPAEEAELAVPKEAADLDDAQESARDPSQEAADADARKAAAKEEREARRLELKRQREERAAAKIALEERLAPVEAALAAAGLPAVLVDSRAGGSAYRIVGRRRLARLAELIGDPPPQAPPGEWPV